MTPAHRPPRAQPGRADAAPGAAASDPQRGGQAPHNPHEEDQR
jgi:hypothetical protein